MVPAGQTEVRATVLLVRPGVPGAGPPLVSGQRQGPEILLSPSSPPPILALPVPPAALGSVQSAGAKSTLLIKPHSYKAGNYRILSGKSGLELSLCGKLLDKL